MLNADQLSQLRQTFITEAQEGLNALEEQLLAFQGDSEALNALFRAAHNLKGSAHSVEASAVGEIAHVLEELFLRWREDKLTPRPAQVDWALSCVDVLRSELALFSSGDAAVAVSDAGSKSAEQEATVRLPLRRLDALLDRIGELVIARGRLSAQLAADVPDVSAMRDFNEGIERLFADLQEDVTHMRLVPIGPLLQRMRRTLDDRVQEGR